MNLLIPLAVLVSGQVPVEPTRDLLLLGWAQGTVVSAPDKNNNLVVEWNHPFLHPDYAIMSEVEDKRKQLSIMRDKGRKLPKGLERDQITQAFVDGLDALASLKNDSYKTIPANNQVTVRLEPWTRYRQEKLPVDIFNDKGDILPVTPAMVRRLREPLHWPGYQSQKSQLEDGKGVLMHMAMRKTDPAVIKEGRAVQLLVRLVLIMENVPSMSGADPLAAPR